MTEFPGDVGRIEARVGEPFAVRLPGHPTAGYRWTVTAPADRIRAHEGARDPAPGRNVGAASAQRFIVEPLAPGPATIELTYKRPWESQPAHRHVIHVDVR
jgi:predicted secreted protein